MTRSLSDRAADAAMQRTEEPRDQARRLLIHLDPIINPRAALRLSDLNEWRCWETPLETLAAVEHMPEPARLLDALEEGLRELASSR